MARDNAKRMVDTFDVQVRHQGNILHTIPKAGITMREIILLRAIHGEDGVPDATVKKVGEREVDETRELFHLARAYANTSDQLSGKKLVEKVFSTSLAGFETWLNDEIEQERMEREEQREKNQREAVSQQAAATTAAATAAVAVALAAAGKVAQPQA